MNYTIEQMAKIYVNTVFNAEPNGWGQYCHPEFGQSHHIMIHMTKRFGLKETQKAIDEAVQQEMMDV